MRVGSYSKMSLLTFLRHSHGNNRNKIQERHWCLESANLTQHLGEMEKIWDSNSLKFHFLSYKIWSIKLSTRKFWGSLDLMPPSFDQSLIFSLRDLPKVEEWPGHFPVWNLPMSREQRPNHIACYPPSHEARVQPTFPGSSLIILLNSFPILTISKQIYHIFSAPYSCMFVQNTSPKFPCTKCSSCSCPLSKPLLNPQGQGYLHSYHFSNCAWGFSQTKQRVIFTRWNDLIFCSTSNMKKTLYWALLGPNMKISRCYLTTQWSDF